MCVNCDLNVLNEALEALKPVFESFGKRETINAIHDYFHAGQPDIMWHMSQDEENND